MRPSDARSVDVWDATCQLWAGNFGSPEVSPNDYSWENTPAIELDQLTSAIEDLTTLELDGVEAFCTFGWDCLIWEFCYEAVSAGVLGPYIACDRAIRNLNLPEPALGVVAAMIERSVNDRGPAAALISQLTSAYEADEIANIVVVGVCTTIRAITASLIVSGASEFEMVKRAASSVNYYSLNWMIRPTSAPTTRFARRAVG